MNKVIKIIITILIIIESIFMYLTYKSFTNKPSNINEVAVKSTEELPINNNSFAIMLENTSGGFTASDDKTQWPDPNTYIYFGSSCYDGSGKPVETNVTFDTTSKKFTMKTKTSSYCYISFARKTSSLGKIIQNAGDQIETMSNMQAREDTLKRFQGTKEEVLNNYICLGTTDKITCTETPGTYMYRIIGIVTNDNETTKEKAGQLKVIKKEALNNIWNYGSDPATWGEPCDMNSCINGGCFLTNATYHLTEQFGSAGKYWSGNENEENNVIVPHSYQYADENNVMDGFTSAEIYMYEKNIWNAGDNKGISNNRIGLMYLSDYVLASENGARCLLGSWSNQTYITCQKSWIFLWDTNDSNQYYTNWEWTMSRINDTYAWTSTKDNTPNDINRTLSGAYRPVFYLSEKIKIDPTTTGTIDNPYIITDVG